MLMTWATGWTVELLQDKKQEKFRNGSASLVSGKTLELHLGFRVSIIRGVLIKNIISE